MMPRFGWCVIVMGLLTIGVNTGVGQESIYERPLPLWDPQVRPAQAGHPGMPDNYVPAVPPGMAQPGGYPAPAPGSNMVVPGDNPELIPGGRQDYQPPSEGVWVPFNPCSPENVCRRQRKECFNDFDTVNAFHWFDVEKRFFVGYFNGQPQRSITKAGYNRGHWGEGGAEILPFVITDGDTWFTRWGWTMMFQYGNFEGRRVITLQSRKSGNRMGISGGDMYSFVIGPTYRIDYDFCGITTISPVFMTGVSFDWVRMKDTMPQSIDTFFLDEFKLTGFDIGGVVRGGMDFSITDYFRFGVGAQFKFAQTDVLVNQDDWRKHFGVWLRFSHDF